MKKIKKWRYYCEYCGKAGGSSFHMKNHEESCTKNPNRKCGFCSMGDIMQKSSDELKKFMLDEIIETVSWENDYGDTGEYQTFKDGLSEEDAIKKLREFTEDCPACMLTAMRLTVSTTCFTKFDWAEEKKSFFDDHRPEPNYYY